jgi:hypothetical protein
MSEKDPSLFEKGKAVVEIFSLLASGGSAVPQKDIQAELTRKYEAMPSIVRMKSLKDQLQDAYASKKEEELEKKDGEQEPPEYELTSFMEKMGSPSSEGEDGEGNDGEGGECGEGGEGEGEGGGGEGGEGGGGEGGEGGGGEGGGGK